MTDLFNSLDSGEVISIQQDAQVLVGHRIFRVSELNEAISNYLKTSVDNWTEDKSDWFTTQGINCEALRFGSNAWQKGRIRLCLEFCPDEVSPISKQVSNSNPVVATPAPVAPVASTPVMAAPTAPSIAVTATSTVEATNHPAPVNATPIPVAGIATVGAGVAVMAAAATAAAATIETPRTPNVAEAVAPSAPVASVAPLPAIADVVLEADDKPTTSNREGLDEIAFDFDVNSDNLGTMVPNGMMELDLTDLDLDRAENDYLDFENSALADPTLELNPIHSIDKSENSGMLIDEVWNEMSQPNWPGIH
jgi:KGK domain